MESRYKLLCLDLDGTLLTNEKIVTERVKQSLYQAKQQGVRIALLSGRMPLAIELIEQQIGFSSIKAAAAGTYILDGDQCISSQTMPAEVAEKVYYLCAEKCNVPLWIYQDRRWFVTKKDSTVEYEAGLIKHEPFVVDIAAMMKEWNESNTGPNKLLFGAKAEIISEIEATLKQSDFPEIDFAKSTETYLEIFPKGADKGKAIEIICQTLGIDPEDTIAIGDQELDLPMLKAAGLSIAMGNAPDYVKEVADFVTTSNEEDGVAVAIDKFL